jgi:hypothetical protein
VTGVAEIMRDILLVFFVFRNYDPGLTLMHYNERERAMDVDMGS